VRRFWVAAAVVVLGALVFAGGAQACSCLRMTPDEAMERADAAIVASLVEVVPRDGYRADYRYRVQRVFKSGQGIRAGRTIAVRSARQSAACGLPQQVERVYGLFLTRSEGRWSGGLCGVVEPRLLEAAPGGARLRRSSSGADHNCAS
jgi:hypothetical protein